MDEEQQPISARELFLALRDHEGPDAFGAVVTPWLARAVVGYPAWLAKAAESLCREDFDGSATLHEDMSWELYALSRVSDVLLLAHQPPYEAGGEAPWAHRLHLLDQWPALGLDQYLHLFTGLGLSPFQETGMFDPFLHEIVEVEQAEDPEEPVRVTEVAWPGLWLGPLLFSRAGVRVRAGARHAERAWPTDLRSIGPSCAATGRRWTSRMDGATTHSGAPASAWTTGRPRADASTQTATRTSTMPRGTSAPTRTC